MLFWNLLAREKIAVVGFLGEPFLRSSNFGAKVRFSFLSSSENWVHNNELFQRHPRLRVLEQKCRKTFRHLGQLLSYVIVSGLHRNPFVMSRLLYLSLVDLEEGDEIEKSKFGVRIFDRIENPNVFSWNTLIRFFADFHHATAVDYYMQMLREGKFPDGYTFPFLLQACEHYPHSAFVEQVHCHSVKMFTFDSLFVQNSLLHAYLLCNSVKEARSLFDEMPEKDAVSWTTVISWLVSQSYYNEAIHFYRQMVGDSFQTPPNAATIVSTMSACSGLGSIVLTRCLHVLLEKVGWLESNISVVNSLIDAYAKCGDLACARNVFNDTTPKRDLYSWTAIISAYAMHGHGIEALSLFLQMQQNCGVIPDEVTYYAVLSGCAHCGLVEEGLSIFHSMIADHTIKLDHKHFCCIVDLLGRAGMLDQAFNIIEKIPMEPNLAVLGSLLSNCRLHNNIKMTQDVLAKIELLNHTSGGSTVLLSNVYAVENQWGKVIRIRKEMRQRMWEKPAGRSWIQVKGAIFEFVARNESSAPPALELNNVLNSLEKISRLI